MSLSTLQQTNAKLDKQKNVLYAAGLADPSEALSADEVGRRFGNVRAMAIRVEDGEAAPQIDPETFEARKAAIGPDTGRVAPPNASAIKRMARHQVIYHVVDEAGEVGMIVLPIKGYGLWGTLYGFLALDADTRTVRGITYYEHKETPGLGGEVDNPSWKGALAGANGLRRQGRIRNHGDQGPSRLARRTILTASTASRARPSPAAASRICCVSGWATAAFGPYLEKFRASRSQGTERE